MVRGFLLVIIALSIDALQALISLVFFVLGFTGLTLGGAAAGAIAGQQVCSNWAAFVQTGCSWLGSAVGAISGTLVQPYATAVTLPLFTALGVAVNITLGFALGGGLIVLMIFLGVFYPKNLFWTTGELIPLANNLPFWTVFTISCLWKAHKTENKSSSVMSAVLSFAIPGGLAVQNVNTAIERGRQNVLPAAQPTAEQPSDQKQPRTPAVLINRDIRPPKAANDNAHTPYGLVA